LDIGNKRSIRRIKIAEIKFMIGTAGYSLLDQRTNEYILELDMNTTGKIFAVRKNLCSTNITG
jgi:hypothetical protein